MSSPPAPTNLSTRTVNVAAIERELAELWHEPHADCDTPQQVTRAVMSNLIIFCNSRDQAVGMPEEISAIVQQHPARVLLLVADAAAANAELEASVSAHAHFVAGGRQVCSEHITVIGSGSATRRLPSATRSLLLGDLPTALWWAAPQPPPLGGDLFEELSLMADQIIYESLGWLDPVRGMMAVAEWGSSELNEQVLGDLQWRRLKLWRRLISQALAPEVVPDALQSITELRVEHGPHGLPQAWLLIGWLASRLGWKPAYGQVQGGVEIHWNFESASGPIKITIRRLSEGDPKVRNLMVKWKAPAGPGTARFTALGPARLQAAVNDTEPRTLIGPLKTRAGLVAKQLPDLEKDQVFTETLQHAGGMAAALA